MFICVYVYMYIIYIYIHTYIYIYIQYVYNFIITHIHILWVCLKLQYLIHCPCAMDTPSPATSWRFHFRPGNDCHMVLPRVLGLRNTGHPRAPVNFRRGKGSKGCWNSSSLLITTVDGQIIQTPIHELEATPYLPRISMLWFRSAVPALGV